MDVDICGKLLKEGFLLKKSPAPIKGWQARHFRLHEFALRYSEPTSWKPQAKQRIDLCQIEEINASGREMTITIGEQRQKSYLLMASSEKEALEWCEAIQQALDRYKLPSVAVLGVGALGKHIVVELLLLGSPVTVYDRGLAEAKNGQEQLDKTTASVLFLECQEKGLLDLAGLKAPPQKDGKWIPDAGGQRQAILCKTLKDAVKNADIVLEAVPDDVTIKKAIFEEAVKSAPPHALFCTSTISIPLQELQQAVSQNMDALSSAAMKLRLCGMRFLMPVVFIPFLEITVTTFQIENGVRDMLLAHLQRWGKSAFKCDVQSAIGDEAAAKATTQERIRLGFSRFRLDDMEMVVKRQLAEARLRKARRMGVEALSQLRGRDLFDYGGEDACCICLDSLATVKSILCGHKCLCDGCADQLLHYGQYRASSVNSSLLGSFPAPKSAAARCPICCVRFVRQETAKAELCDNPASASKVESCDNPAMSYSSCDNPAFSSSQSSSQRFTPPRARSGSL